MIARLITLLVLMFISTNTVSANDGRDKWPKYSQAHHGINYKKFHKKHHRTAVKLRNKCHGVN